MTVRLRSSLAHGQRTSGKTARPALFKLHPRCAAAARAAFLIGIAAGCGLPAASGAPTLVTDRAALHATSDTVANGTPRSEAFTESSNPAQAPQHDANASVDAFQTPFNMADLLWASRGNVPVPSDTTLRYGAPILASMCGAAPTLCVPDEYLEAARDRSHALSANAAADGDAEADATRVPLAGASPWMIADAADYDPRFIARTGRIEGNLHDALTQADLPADIVAQAEHLFDGRFGATAAALPGDGFRLVYERGDPTDAVTRHSHVSAVEVRFADRTYTALWFVAPGSAHGEYYTFDGSLLPAEPFAMPVNYDRISSPFGARMHPVSGEQQIHTGVDLTAPAGTPVLSAAAGTVAFVGVSSGYGRNVVVDHGNGYTTCYAHLSAFARGLHAGMQVAQGDRIGAVGRSGVATGPHLHYEVRVADRPVDPLTLTERDFAPPLTPAQRFALAQAASTAHEQLAAITDTGTRVASARPAPFF